MVELHGGTGGISQPAVTRKLFSGSNLDERTSLGTGNPRAQRAVERDMHARFFTKVALQPNCRTAGLPPLF
eukprot:5421233-Pyramimonas_sp.AAC.1